MGQLKNKLQLKKKIAKGQKQNYTQEQREEMTNKGAIENKAPTKSIKTCRNSGSNKKRSTRAEDGEIERMKTSTNRKNNEFARRTLNDSCCSFVTPTPFPSSPNSVLNQNEFININ